MFSSIRSIGAIALALAFALTFAPQASAQFNNQWLEFTSGAGKIKNPDGSIATHITTDTDEKDYAWGDVNKDGWIDLVVVRKTPASFPGPRVNYLLMNEGGVLVDRTTQYATDSDVAGDMGFNTATDDRDVELVDVNGDGWLDMVTSTTDLTAASEPKHLTHPRIYINKGSISGVWQGFRYEDARIPQLLVGATPGTVRFCDLAFGDVTGDGFPDLYFNDYDLTENGFPEAGGTDLNDRLLINDGNGFFTDQTAARMTSTMTNCQFGTACAIVDMNLDGRNDIVRITTLNSPPAQSITVAYNDAIAPFTGVGNFDSYDGTAYAAQPYHVAVGDLNNDGRPDIINSDDGTDGYKFNTGVDGLGRVIWSPAKVFTWLAGSGDDGFGGSNLVADLDNDGWNDVIICDFDVDLLGCGRRSKIYHNQTGTVGSTTIVLREEKEQSGSGGWFGAKGLLASDMTGGYDAAVFDLDNDGDKDLVMGRCSGTYVWLSQLNPCPVIQYGQALPNTTGFPAVIGSNGATSISANTLTLTCTGLPPNAAGIFYHGTTKIDPCVPFGNGLRCVGGTIKRGPVVHADAGGNATFQVDFINTPAFQGLVPGDVRFVQFWYRNPAAGGAGFNLSDALEVHFCD